MPYEYLPELATADLAFRAWGSSLEEVFVSASEAVMNAMIENVQEIQPKVKKNIDLKNDALDMLLFDLLQEVIYFKDTEQLLIRIKSVEVKTVEGQYVLSALAEGDTLDPVHHQQRVDVKAVTFHQFKLEQTDSGWEAIVVLDI